MQEGRRVLKCCKEFLRTQKGIRLQAGVTIGGDYYYYTAFVKRLSKQPEGHHMISWDFQETDNRVGGRDRIMLVVAIDHFDC